MYKVKVILRPKIYQAWTAVGKKIQAYHKYKKNTMNDCLVILYMYPTSHLHERILCRIYIDDLYVHLKVLPLKSVTVSKSNVTYAAKILSQ